MFENNWKTKRHLSVELIPNKMHEITLKLVITQKQYVDGSYWVVATNYWWVEGNF